MLDNIDQYKLQQTLGKSGMKILYFIKLEEHNGVNSFKVLNRNAETVYSATRLSIQKLETHTKRHYKAHKFLRFMNLEACLYVAIGKPDEYTNSKDKCIICNVIRNFDVFTPNKNDRIHFCEKCGAENMRLNKQ